MEKKSHIPGLEDSILRMIFLKMIFIFNASYFFFHPETGKLILDFMRMKTWGLSEKDLLANRHPLPVQILLQSCSLVTKRNLHRHPVAGENYPWGNRPSLHTKKKRLRKPWILYDLSNI